VEAETLVLEAIGAIFVDPDALGVRTIRAEIDRGLEPGCSTLRGHIAGKSAWVSVSLGDGNERDAHSVIAACADGYVGSWYITDVGMGDDFDVFEVTLFELATTSGRADPSLSIVRKLS
jgi:hypothetical protein